MARTSGSKKSSAELPSVTDPSAPLDVAGFLAAVKPVSRLLVEDLAARAKADGVRRTLEAQYATEKEARRTAESLEEWKAALLAQLAAAWVLSCVFVRTLEDRGLIGERRLAGPGAEDSQRLFLELAPSLSERDYLLLVFRELTRLPAARDLFDARHNLVWRLAPSGEAAKALLRLFRTPSSAAPAFRFGQADTRFLGDLYQDLDDDVRDRFALLQTPRFVERYILDRTLTRALDRFGLEQTTLVDPTCGSGHFLLGAFERLFAKWQEAEPAKGVEHAARRALDQVYGADLNPYAIAIARFRLTLAYLDRVGLRAIEAAPALPIHLAVADSLLHNPQLRQIDLGYLTTEGAAWSSQFSLEEPEAAWDVLHREHAAVVGNPPYIVVKDAARREEYRKAYTSAAGKYSLAAPFAERFFQLAKEGGAVGMITANSFMKREFGKKLIQECLPKWNLDGIVNTSGAYIPGHGTPTVLLFGTNEPPKGSDVLAVLAKRGEPSTPEDPEHGLVWRSIADHGDEVGFENEYVSVARVARTTLDKHPWSLGGGGAAELKELLEERAEKRLRDVATVGVFGMTNADDCMLMEAHQWARTPVEREFLRPLAIGEEIRDWAWQPTPLALYPYKWPADLIAPGEAPGLFKYLWPYRTTLGNRATFGGGTYFRDGLPWWKWHQVTEDRVEGPSIAYAEVATHNHFVLDRGGKVFKQTAPIIKLPATANEEDHLALLAYLNSSTACFWMKQVSMNKGGSGIGRGIQDEAWESRFQFDGSKLGAVPLLSPLPSEVGRRSSNLMDERCRSSARALVERSLLESSGAGEVLSTAALYRHGSGATLARAASLQEELDWLVYEACGLLTDQDLSDLRRARGEALPDFPRQFDARPEAIPRSGLWPGHRAFEVVLLRDQPNTQWFSRNGYRSPTETAEAYSPAYRCLIEARVRIIDRNPQIRLLEQPEYKRRWTMGDFDAELTEAACAEALARTEHGLEGTTQPTTARSLVTSMLRSLPAAGRELLDHVLAKGTSLESAMTGHIEDAAVPFLAALRHTDAGLEKRAAWERTWDLQRREDAGEQVGDILVPPKYDQKDYRDATYWRLRGKLDVPKERFISYPGCESDEDKEPLYGWAGWTHLQQAQALAALYKQRRDEGWKSDRLTPMLAGLLELLPWVKQWHNEPSAEFEGLRLGDYFESYLDTECRELGLTHDDLRAWRPEAKGRGRAKASGAEEEKGQKSKAKSNPMASRKKRGGVELES
jgi:hypothetical protein